MEDRIRNMLVGGGIGLLTGINTNLQRDILGEAELRRKESLNEVERQNSRLMSGSGYVTPEGREITVEEADTYQGDKVVKAQFLLDNQKKAALALAETGEEVFDKYGRSELEARGQIATDRAVAQKRAVDEYSISGEGVAAREVLSDEAFELARKTADYKGGIAATLEQIKRGSKGQPGSKEYIDKAKAAVDLIKEMYPEDSYTPTKDSNDDPIPYVDYLKQQVSMVMNPGASTRRAGRLLSAEEIKQGIVLASQGGITTEEYSMMQPVDAAAIQAGAEELKGKGKRVAKDTKKDVAVPQSLLQDTIDIPDGYRRGTKRGTTNRLYNIKTGLPASTKITSAWRSRLKTDKRAKEAAKYGSYDQY